MPASSLFYLHERLHINDAHEKAQPLRTLLALTLRRLLRRNLFFALLEAVLSRMLNASRQIA